MAVKTLEYILPSTHRHLYESKGHVDAGGCTRRCVYEGEAIGSNNRTLPCDRQEVSLIPKDTDVPRHPAIAVCVLGRSYSDS